MNADENKASGQSRTRIAGRLLIVSAALLAVELFVVFDDVLSLFWQDRIPYALMASAIWTWIVTAWHTGFSVVLLIAIAILGRLRQTLVAALITTLGLLPAALVFLAEWQSG